MVETGSWKCLTCHSLFATDALHRKHRPNGYCIFVKPGAAPHPPAPAAAQPLAAAAPPAATSAQPLAAAAPPAATSAQPLAAAAPPAARRG